MKENLKVKILGLCLILLGNLMTSCQKNVTCTSCEQKPEGQKEIVLDLADQSISISCYYYFGQTEYNNAIEFGYSNLNNSKFSEIKSLVRKMVKQEIDPYIITFYYDDFLSDTTSGNIVGFSTYTYADKKITHRLYKKENNSYNEDLTNCAEVDDIYTNQMGYILENSFSIPRFSQKAFISVKNVDIMKDVPTSRRNFLFLKQKFNFFKRCLKSTSAPEPCGYGCTYYAKNTICVQTITGYYCKPIITFCPTEGEITKLKNDPTVPDSVYEAYDTTLLRSFRDNFLSKYSVGQKYINYYYSLAQYLVDNIPLNLSIETATVIVKVNSCINKMMDPTVYGDNIVIDEQFGNELISLFDKYKDLNSDIDYKTTLDDLIYDINSFKGLTVNELLTKLS